MNTHEYPLSGGLALVVAGHVVVATSLLPLALLWRLAVMLR